MKKHSCLGLAALAAGIHLAVEVRADDYVAHEWGTFTSVQASEGEPEIWQPLRSSELPRFVYDLAWPDGRGVGTRTFHGLKEAGTLQRMETPVIYFHAPEPVTVSVTVDFPLGRITEWYPQDVTLRARARDVNGAQGAPNRLHWPSVQVLGRESEATFPVDSSGSHYFAARTAEANPLRLANPGEKEEFEKFLFYRGVGSFAAPLRVSVDAGTGMLRLENQGAEPLSSLYVLQVHQGQAQFRHLEGLEPRATANAPLASAFDWQPLPTVRAALGAALQESLVQEGLYASEAEAMVRTWDESWFAEPGVRVLYALPRAWTDRTLPLRLEPAPAELVRVMVGRAEVILPEVEFALLKAGIRHATGKPADQVAAVAAVQQLELGRFLEAAVSRVARRSPPVPALQQAWAAFRQSAGNTVVAGR